MRLNISADCYLFFDTSTLSLGFWGDQCATIAYYSDFLHDVIICAMVLFINSATFYFLQSSNKVTTCYESNYSVLLIEATGLSS